MWLFDQVLQRPVEFAAFEDCVPWLREGLTRFARSQPPAPLPGLRLAVADARQIPLPDAGVSLVFSIYFTDMLPLWPVAPKCAACFPRAGFSCTSVHSTMRSMMPPGT